MKRKRALFWIVTVLLAVLVSGSYFWKTTAGGRNGYVESSDDPATWGNYNYARLADAFRAGQLALREKPLEALTALPNPYDPFTRPLMRYLWDCCLYKGNYYLYFTPVPVLVFFLPYHWLRGNYPSQGLVLDIMFLATFIAMISAMYTLYRELFQRRLILWSSVILVLGIANGNRIALDNPTWYTLAVGSAAMWVAVFFLACARMLRNGPSPLMGVTAGLSISLAAWSRPHLGCLALVPFGLLISAEWSKRKLLRKSYFGYAVALFLGASVIGAYNYRRFENPLEFGFHYLLTAKDNAHYPPPMNPKFVLQREWITLPAVLVRLPKWQSGPGRFITTKDPVTTIPPSGDYLYWDPTVGIFILCPFLVLALIAFHFSIRQEIREVSPVLFGYGLLGAATFLIIFLGNMGCVAGRYNIDIIPTMLFGTLVLVLEFIRSNETKYHMPLAAISLSVLSVVINLLF